MSDDTLEVPCAKCGRKNRLPKSRVNDNPKCGACKESVFSGTPVTVSLDSFAREVEQYPLPVLIDFWAPWCPPCRAIGPVLEAISSERRGRIKIVKVNVDENPALAQKYGASSIPLLVLQNGTRVVDQKLGAHPKAALDSWLDTVSA